jgi:thiamine-phosphate pyrophosphorylase
MPKPFTNHSTRLNHFINNVTIYPVSCEKLGNGRTDIEWLDNVIAGGAQIVQLRDKISDDRTLLAKAHVFRQKTREAGILFLVNNRIDIALLADADGIHLGNSDIPALEARRLAPEFIIGISANTLEQAARAEENGASYYNIGPIFQTATKAGLTNFIGPEAIGRYSKESNLPFTVMGGIKKEHIKELTAQGATRLAVVTALTKAKDLPAETGFWHEQIMNFKR